MPAGTTTDICPDCGAEGSECGKTACGYDCVLFNGRDPGGYFCDCDQCQDRRRRLEGMWDMTELAHRLAEGGLLGGADMFLQECAKLPQMQAVCDLLRPVINQLYALSDTTPTTTEIGDK